MTFNDITKINTDEFHNNVITVSDILFEGIEEWDCTVFEYFHNDGRSDKSIVDSGDFHSDRISCDDYSRHDGLPRNLL